MRREGELLGKTTKKWLVIALGTLILTLTYFGVLKDSYRLFYGIMACLFLYGHVLLATPVTWDHPKGMQSCLNMILQESLRFISILLLCSIVMGPEEFKKGTLLAIATGIAMGIPVGIFRYIKHIEK